MSLESWAEEADKTSTVTCNIENGMSECEACGS